MAYDRYLLSLLLTACCLSISNPTFAQHTLQFLAAKPYVPPGALPGHGPLPPPGGLGPLPAPVMSASRIPGPEIFHPGHAFMIIATPTRSGVKEEMFGFNTKEEKPGYVRMFVGTTGEVKDEWKVKIPFVARDAIGFAMPITDEQRKAVYSLVDRWNTQHDFQATESNCIDFIADVAQTVGLPPVPRSRMQLPADYVESLKIAYQQKLAEDRRRERQDEIATAVRKLNAEREVKIREQDEQSLTQQSQIAEFRSGMSTSSLNNPLPPSAPGNVQVFRPTQPPPPPPALQTTTQIGGPQQNVKPSKCPGAGNSGVVNCLKTTVPSK